MAMTNDSKFICNVNDIPEVAKAVGELRTFQTKAKEESKFLERRAKEIKKEMSKHWCAVFKAAQTKGLIKDDLDAEKFNMHLNGPETEEQFVITPHGDGDGEHPLKRMLSDLFSN